MIGLVPLVGFGLVLLASAEGEERGRKAAIALAAVLFVAWASYHFGRDTAMRDLAAEPAVAALHDLSAYRPGGVR